MAASDRVQLESSPGSVDCSLLSRSSYIISLLIHVGSISGEKEEVTPTCSQEVGN